MALASFTNVRTAGPQALVNATLPGPTGLITSNGGCSGGNTQTNVSVSWSASTSLDANGNYLVDNYAALRSASQAGPYSSVGATSGQPPAATLTDTNPSGAAAPQVFIGNGATQTVHAVNNSTHTGTSVTTGTMGIEPNGLAVAPDGTSVVATEGASNEVQVITVSTDAVARTVAIPKVGSTASRPDAVAITPDGLTAYIVDGANNLVYPMTISTGLLGTPIAVGEQGRSRSHRDHAQWLQGLCRQLRWAYGFRHNDVIKYGHGDHHHWIWNYRQTNRSCDHTQCSPYLCG